MEQRQVRVGDVLDDYCPHERRVTNHAVVAIVGDKVKLTRCTTCENEHAYKEARVPPRKQTRLVAALSTSESGPSAALQSSGKSAAAELAAGAATTDAPAADDTQSGPADAAAPLAIDSVRRPLIRATLERPEGTPPPARQPPVFTIRESGRDSPVDRKGNQARKRRNGGRPAGEVNGNRVDGQQGQSTRSGPGKNVSRSSRPRSNANANGNRTERPNRGPSRSRGKGRSR